MARATDAAVDPQAAAQALAKAIADGDIVTFRAIFQPWSPARGSETERFGTPKYAYFAPSPEEQDAAAFREALEAVQAARAWDHILGELEAERPPQFPSDLLVRLADRAVALGKFGNAAQTYELLRIRGRMQALFVDEAEKALASQDFAAAARGFRIAASLEYDYAAFPEPLPKVADWQKSALILHGDYPDTPEKSVPLRETPHLLRTAFAYLLDSTELAARIEPIEQEAQVALLDQLVRNIDPAWDAFAGHFHEAGAHMAALADRFEKAGAAEGESNIEYEVAEQTGPDPIEIPALLLGRRLPEDAWWQYLKELAYTHPPAALFVARQLVPGGEILVPRCRAESPVARALGLLDKG